MLDSITKENFNQLLSRFSTNELEGLLDKFPYFQQAHILLAKKYQQENNPKFDEQLQLAVLYSQDREMLASIFDESNVIPLKVVSLNSDSNAPVANKTANEEPEERKVQFSDTEIIIPQEKPLEISEVIIKSLPQDEIVEKPESVLPEPEVETQKDSFAVTKPHTFDEWLSAFATQQEVKVEFHQQPVTPEPEEQDKELEQLIVSNLPMQELMEEETHYSKGLDTFIEEQKQKHKPQEVRMPAYENEMAPELITETMAKIYEMQKKYQKAIHAYELLALKYPEKNDFFAARINYLKNIL